MSRPLITTLKVLAFLLWVLTTVIVVIALIAAMGDVEIPWLDPLESLIGVAITGIGGVIAWLTARRGERMAQQQLIVQRSGAVAQGERATAVNIPDGNKGPVAIAEVVNQVFLDGRKLPASDESLNQSLLDYLRWLQDKTATIELRGVSRGGRQVSLDLDRVYVPLEATVAAEENIQELSSGGDIGSRMMTSRGRPEQREITLDHVLTLGRQLVITGGPGCGKTTVLRHIAWVLASAFIDDNPSIAALRLGLGDELPLPLYIPLSAFAEHLRTLDRAREMGSRVADTEFRLDYFIPGYLVENAATHGLPEDFFSRLLERDTQIILLLDGLDEVPNEAERKRVREKVEQLVTGRRDKMRIVVTCRTAAYHDQTALDRKFLEVRVKPLEDDHIAALVTHAYEDVYKLDPSRREKKTDELLEGIRRLEEDRRRFSSEAERLITSPLLVRMLIIVHQREGRNLPEQRAELYWKATEVMLMPDYALDEEVADRIGRLIGGRKELHRDLSQHLAFHMHNRGAQQGREIDESGLRSVLSTDQRFVPYIDDYIALTRLRGTLLEELLGTYRFVHLAFQEFLAARYLAEVKRGEGIDVVAEFLENGPVLDSWWREAALLVPGYLAFTSEPNALGLLQRLAGIDESAAVRNLKLPANVQLAAAEIAAVAIMEWESDKVDLRRTVADRLVALLTDENLTFSNPLRGLAGRALGRLDDPRPDVNAPVPVTVLIPQGEFIMGSERREGQPGYDDKAYKDESTESEERFTLDLPAYRIGKYPVTVAQYRRFVEYVGDDGRRGYEIDRFWTPDGRKWRSENSIATPRLWDDPTWNVDNHPVIGVSWYEAVAYCAWLTATNPGRRFRLPDEAMWEKAARGTDGRRWPWDDKWDAAKLNAEQSIGRTSAVGIFPAGKSPYELFDCAGNVWEWCSGPGYNSGADYPFKVRTYQEDLLEKTGTRALRGGSWVGGDLFTRAAFRGDDYPVVRGSDVGFRVVELLSDSGF